MDERDPPWLWPAVTVAVCLVLIYVLEVVREEKMDNTEHYFEWTLEQGPDDANEWLAGGPTPTKDLAIAEGMRYFGQYSKDTDQLRLTVWAVTRESVFVAE